MNWRRFFGGDRPSPREKRVRRDPPHTRPAPSPPRPEPFRWPHRPGRMLSLGGVLLDLYEPWEPSE